MHSQDFKIKGGSLWSSPVSPYKKKKKKKKRRIGLLNLLLHLGSMNHN
jgi:hypothetical protein